MIVDSPAAAAGDRSLAHNTTSAVDVDVVICTRPSRGTGDAIGERRACGWCRRLAGFGVRVAVATARHGTGEPSGGSAGVGNVRRSASANGRPVGAADRIFRHRRAEFGQ